MPNELVSTGDQPLDLEQVNRFFQTNARNGFVPTLTTAEVVARAKNMTYAQRLGEAFARYETLPNWAILLPLMFSLRREPFTIDRHFQFEPMFSTYVAKRTTFKTGRQVGKSMSVAANLLGTAAIMPFFNQLYVTPLYETTRRFSSTYVSPFIDQSPIRDLFIDSKCSRNVLQRSFRNQSLIFFSYAGTDANRTRGLNTHRNFFDESQDINPSHVEVVNQTMAGSVDFSVEVYTGTSKTTDTTLEYQWNKSSKAEWHIRCGCGFDNIPSREHHLDAMTGPRFVTREISESKPGVVCAKCGHPLQPWEGFWVHHVPENRIISPGYHMPMQIFWTHYSDSIKWRDLILKRDLAPNTYYNEVCGESYDVGAKLISREELIAASDPTRENITTPEFLHQMRGRYTHRVVAVDWGGGGIGKDGKEGVSRTVAACIGMLPNGKQEVVCGHRFILANNYVNEVRNIFYLLKHFGASHVVHDYGGAGDLREDLMVRAGLPLNMTVPIAYMGVLGTGLMRHIPENALLNRRSYYQLFKARAFVQTCELIRQKGIRFFKFDYEDGDRPGLISDFLALIEHKTDNPGGREVYTIRRDANAKSDDFANAVNIGSCSLFYLADKWPDLSRMPKLDIPPEVLEEYSRQLDADEYSDWGAY